MNKCCRCKQKKNYPWCIRVDDLLGKTECECYIERDDDD